MKLFIGALLGALVFIPLYAMESVASVHTRELEIHDVLMKLVALKEAHSDAVNTVIAPIEGEPSAFSRLVFLALHMRMDLKQIMLEKMQHLAALKEQHAQKTTAVETARNDVMRLDGDITQAKQRLEEQQERLLQGFSHEQL